MTPATTISLNLHFAVNQSPIDLFEVRDPALGPHKGLFFVRLALFLPRELGLKEFRV